MLAGNSTQDPDPLVSFTLFTLTPMPIRCSSGSTRHSTRLACPTRSVPILLLREANFDALIETPSADTPRFFAAPKTLNMMAK